MIDFLLKNGDRCLGWGDGSRSIDRRLLWIPTTHMAGENLPLLPCGCQCLPCTHTINKCNKNKCGRRGRVYNQILVALYKKAKASKMLKL